MQVTIEFSDEELQPVIEAHLKGGGTVQSYIRCAVRYYNKVRKLEEAGHTFGHTNSTDKGSEERFRQYNTIFSTRKAQES